MARIRADYVFGSTTNDPLLVGGTTLTSDGLARLPAVTTPDVAAITLYDGADYEVVHVTAHTASSSSATILRAQEGTVAQQWASGTSWVHGLTVADVDSIAAAAPVRVAAKAKNSAGVTLPAATVTTIPLNQQVFVTAGTHSTTVNNSRLTATEDGDYLVIAVVAHNSTAKVQCRVHKNGSFYGLSNEAELARHVDVVPMVAGDYIELASYQGTAGSTTTWPDETFLLFRRLIGD